MKVHELIDALKLMPQDASVYYLYDVCATRDIDHAWKSRDGRVIMVEDGECIANDDDRPDYAPSVDDDEYWAPSSTAAHPPTA